MTPLPSPATPVMERQPDPGQQWKCGDEFLPFHPQASHVPPDYRDGWNRCYRMALSRLCAQPAALADEQLLDVFASICPEDAALVQMIEAGANVDAISAIGASSAWRNFKRAARAVLAAASRAPAGDAPSDLHAAIMNLPCKPNEAWGVQKIIGYEVGHHDARHAAAVLAAQKGASNA